MALLTVVVDDTFPLDVNTLNVSYRWFSTNDDNSASASDSGEISLGASILAAVMNQNIINAAVTASGEQGVTIGVLDRKVILGGFV